MSIIKDFPEEKTVEERNSIAGYSNERYCSFKIL
jgi:hypothetical protein